MSKASAIIQEWRTNPIKFVYDNFKVDPDEWQKDALLFCGGEVLPRRRLVMTACAGPGKSALLAWIGLHRLTCFAKKGEHPKGAAISCEGRDNLRQNLWAELGKWRERSEFLKNAFDYNQDKISAKDHKETWFLAARSYAKDADSEAIGRSLSGLHSQFPFILLDETGDAPQSVGNKANQIFSGTVIDGLLAMAGNPTSQSGLLYQACVKERHLWNVIKITADPDSPKRTPRVDIEYAREQIKLYGRNNPWVMATILGEFPESGFNTLLSIEEVEAAMNRSLPQAEYEYSEKKLGVDVARFGSDATCLFPRQGRVAFKPVLMRGARTTEISARVAVSANKWGAQSIFCDDTGGYGGGVIDALMQSGHNINPVNFAQASPDERYFNMRSYLWFQMAEWIRTGGCLPNEPQLVRELTTPQYTFQNGKFRLEEKEQIKKRLGYSTDMSDALATTWALPDRPNLNPFDPMTRILQRENQVEFEWNPYES